MCFAVAYTGFPRLTRPSHPSILLDRAGKANSPRISGRNSFSKSFDPTYFAIVRDRPPVPAFPSRNQRPSLMGWARGSLDAGRAIVSVWRRAFQPAIYVPWGGLSRARGSARK